MFDIKQLWHMALTNPRAVLNAPGRLMGRHCVGRKLRGQAKRAKAKKTPFNPR